jgi:DnaJ-domain-containing protein 1
MPSDPYKTLGLSATVSDAELRAAYRRLVQLHHPDHNGGSQESARRFEEVQDAYAEIHRLRGMGPAMPPPGARQRPTPGQRPPTPRTGPDPDPGLTSRLADMERELREAQQARERARQAARKEAAAAAAAKPSARGRASDEELGYVKTDDSFSKILSDARSELADRLAGAREHPAAKRVTDLLDELAKKLG